MKPEDLPYLIVTMFTVGVALIAWGLLTADIRKVVIRFKDEHYTLTSVNNKVVK